MKTIKLTLVALMLVASSMAVKAQSLIGTWETVTVENQTDTLRTQITFNEDGTFTRFNETLLPNLRFDEAKVIYSDGGKWKLNGKGNRIIMKIKPSTVKVENTGDTHKTVAKLAQFESKYGSISSLYIPKIVSLTEDELTILESVEDDSGLQETSYAVKVTYKRIK